MIRAAITAALVASPAYAATCGPAIDGLRELFEKHDQSASFQGTIRNGNRLWVFVNHETGAWTAVEVGGALMCVLAVGTNGVVFEAPPKGDPT